jgi:fibronectin-binding autotransporter adhesin
MKTQHWFRWMALVCLAAGGGVVSAADSTWTGATDALWSTTTNWDPDAPTSADRAIFDGLGNGSTTLDLETGATIAQILFDTANVAAYTLGTSGSQSLTLGTGGSVTVSSTVASNQTIAAGLLLGDGSAGSFTLTNESLTSLLALSGGISGGTGGTAAVQTLVVAGAGNTTISGNLANGGATTLGLTKQGTGTLTLSGTNNTATGDITVAGGRLLVSGTTNISTATTGTVNVGTAAATARLDLSGNLTTYMMNIGTVSGATGAVYQTGGTTTITRGPATLDFQIGAAGGAYGFYGMSGGSFTANEVGLGGAGGGNGTGILDVSGGTFTVNGWLTMSRAGNGGQNSVLNVRGNGLVAVTAGAGLQHNWAGTAVVNVADSAILRVSDNDPSTFSVGTGIVNLNGGTFESAGGLAGGATLSLVNFRGGTLKSLANNTLLAENFTAAYVYGGGATIDTNGFTSTVLEPLLAATGSGVATIPITAGGSGYVAPPLVTISGGGGAGATGFATIDASGTVTGITITNPGTGYTSAPTVTLSGGGGSGATPDAATLAANTSGGLTKTGTGTLVLGGLNSYTGSTTISAGTLQVGIATRLGSIGSSNGLVNSGSLVLSNVGDMPLSGVVSGAGPITRFGAGTLTLAGENTFTGAVTMSGGTLLADATTAASPLGNSPAITTTGQTTIRLVGAAGLSRTQTVNGLTASSGAVSVQVANPGTATTLNLAGSGGTGTITRSGTATLDFRATAGTFGTDALVLSSPSQALSNGILGPWATVAGSDWATVSSGTVVAYSGYADIAAQGSMLADGSTSNVRVASAGSGGAIALGAATTTVNTLLQGTGTAATIDTAGSTLRAVGIMVGAGQQALTIGSTVGSGSLAPAAAGGQLILANYGSNPLTVNAVVANNSTASAMVKTGSGAVTLAAVSTYTGDTAVNDGLLTLAGSRTGQGTLTVNGGTLRVAGTVTSELPTIGAVAGGRGMLDITGGLTTTRFELGNAVGAAGVITQSGNLTTTATTSFVGNVAGGYGAWLMSGGTATLRQLQVAQFGNGIFVQSGGSVTAADFPVIGRFGGGVGHATISGGFFTQSGTANRLIVGENGTGVLTIAGSAAVENVGGTRISMTGGVGTLSLNGGTLTTPFIEDASTGVSLLNLNGGTIRARAASTNFFNALDSVVVQAGGGTIDSNGFDLTIASVLTAPAGNGLATIPVAAGGAGYLAPPLVMITGGGGSGATATATVDGSGAVTGITITNPGTGYTAAPTISLVGGGGAGATSGSATLAANVSGGITKTGAGTLTFTGVSTYTGQTVVNQGTVLVSAANTVRGGATVNAGARLVIGATDAIADAASVTVNGGTFALGAFTDYIGNLTLGNEATVTGDAAASLITNGVVNSKIATTGTGLAGTISTQLALASQFGTVQGNRTQEFEVGSGATLAVTGPIVDTQTGSAARVGSILKTGAGTLQFSGANTFTGTTTVAAGTLTVAATSGIPAGNALTVATGATPGALVIDGGNVARTLTQIGTSTGAGAIVVNSGTLAVAGEIWAGANSTTGSYGALTINGGSVSTTSWLAIGRGATAGTGSVRGILTVTGGSLTVGGGNLAIGAFQGSASASSVMAISGGTVTTVGQVFVGENLSGTLDVSGGNLVTSTTAGVRLKSAGAGTGIVNLRGGTITAGYVNQGGTGTFNFNGGTLQTTRSLTTFMQGLTNAYVYPGGGTIDTNAFDITVAQPLLAPTGEGVASIGVSGGTGYVAPPIVDITGGGGVGATALAVIDASGNLTGITVTNPGVGYTSAPTVALVGGGGSGATIGAVSLAANTTGGLTKTGTGTLTLSGANTFGGTTRITAGSLTIASATALGGTTLDLNALDAGTVFAISQNSTLGGLTGSRNLDMLTRILSIGNNNTSTTYAGVLSNGALTKIGTGTLTLTGANTYGGNTTVEAGSLRLTGSASSTGTLGVGTVAGSTGRFELTGTMTAGNLFAGRVSGANGVIVQSPGSSLTFTTGSEHRVGEVAGGYGAYLVNGGTAAFNNALQIGGAGNGVYVQTDGQVTAGTNWPIIGRVTGGVGHATISGGTFNQTNASTRFIVGENGTGVLTLSGSGAVETVGGIRVSMAGGVGTVNLDGGTILVPFVEDGGGASLFNFDGGTLRARSASGTFLQGLDNAFVHSGGAVIDTNGFAVTVAQPLLAPTGSGISSIAVSSGGSGYAAPPLVTFSGGDGSGATAIATVDASGVLTGIMVTNPGTGYTSAPTVTLVGGAGSGATLGTPALAANVSGGLTKTGVGTLTLSGASSFTGGTTVSGGTLRLSGAGSLAAANAVNLSAAGATFDVAPLTASGLTIGALAGAAGAEVTLGGKQLTFGDASASVFAGVISGTGGGIVKQGLGATTLSGANTYTGPTSIAAGTLLVNGSLAAASAVSVAGGATLGGSGSVGGSVSVLSAGFLSPGNSIGTLEVGSAGLGGTLFIEYDGAGSGSIDRLDVLSGFDITSATVSFASLGSPLDDPAYVFASYGSLTGTQFASVVDLPSGYQIDYAYQGSSIALIPVPEPGALLMVALGGGLAVGLRLRSRRIGARAA